MQVALSTYSLEQKRQQGLSQLDMIPLAVSLGFDSIEFVDVLPPDGVSRTDYAQSLQKACANAGLTVANYTVSADFLKGDLQEEIQRLCGEVDLAVLLGATSMRHDATWGSDQPFEAVLPTLAAGILAVTTYAAQKGVRTMVENHGYFCQDADRLVQLVQAVDYDNFGLLVDMGNFLCTDQDPIDAVTKTAPYAFYAHAKDFFRYETKQSDSCFATSHGKWLQGTILGLGMVPIPQCIAALRTAGYHGGLGLEFEGTEDAIEAVREGLAYLKEQ